MAFSSDADGAVSPAAPAITSSLRTDLASGVLHVDDRRLAGDRDRFLQRADLQLDRDRQRGVPLELDACRA